MVRSSFLQFELAGNLPAPTFQARVDGLDVDARAVAPRAFHCSTILMRDGRGYRGIRCRMDGGWVRLD